MKIIPISEENFTINYSLLNGFAIRRDAEALATNINFMFLSEEQINEFKDFLKKENFSSGFEEIMDIYRKKLEAVALHTLPLQKFIPQLIKNEDAI